MNPSVLVDNTLLVVENDNKSEDVTQDEKEEEEPSTASEISSDSGEPVQQSEEKKLGKWRLTSALIIVEASGEELGLRFVEYIQPDAERPPSIDASTKSGRLQLRTACRGLLLKYVETFQNVTCPALSAYTFVQTPCSKEFCIPTLQMILELDLEPNEFTIEPINWEQARV